ncbi:MAG: hypothetical protein ACK4TP_19320 [Hyphomicrobium sp.]
MQMPPDMLAAVKAHFADEARGWRMTSAMLDTHTETAIEDVGGVPTPTTTVKRSASLTVQSAVMGGKAIIFMIEGGEDAWTSGRAIFNGISFDFDDAALLAQLGNAMSGLGTAAAATIMAEFFGPIPGDGT